jgi:hypothetical protein
MTHNLQRVESADIVTRIAAANHVTPRRSLGAASVTVGDVRYFWVAA